MVALLIALGLPVGAAPSGQDDDPADPTPMISDASPDPRATSSPVGAALTATTPSSTATATATAAPRRDPMVDAVVRLTNAERAKAGLQPLEVNDNLMQAAQGYAGVLAPGPCFEHDCPPVPSLKDRVAIAGYGEWERIGENIAAGDRTAEAVVAGWMTSKGHRENILKPEYREIGVGFLYGPGKYGTYWVQVFGTRWQ